MSRKYELWFSSDKNHFKVMELNVIDDRLDNYFVDFILSNLEWDIDYVTNGFDKPIDGFKIIKVKNNA